MESALQVLQRSNIFPTEKKELLQLKRLLNDRMNREFEIIQDVQIMHLQSGDQIYPMDINEMRYSRPPMLVKYVLDMLNLVVRDKMCPVIPNTVEVGRNCIIDFLTDSFQLNKFKNLDRVKQINVCLINQETEQLLEPYLREPALSGVNLNKVSRVLPHLRHIIDVKLEVARCWRKARKTYSLRQEITRLADS